MQLSGRIKWFNPEKGYGFITPEKGEGDIFLHISTVEEAGIASLEPGQQVTFSLASNPKDSKKKSAVNLVIRT